MHSCLCCNADTMQSQLHHMERWRLLNMQVFCTFPDRYRWGLSLDLRIPIFVRNFYRVCLLARCTLWVVFVIEAVFTLLTVLIDNALLRNKIVRLLLLLVLLVLQITTIVITGNVINTTNIIISSICMYVCIFKGVSDCFTTDSLPTL